MTEVIAGLAEGYEDITVRDMWGEGGGWDFNRIAPFVTAEKRLELMVVVVDTVTGA